MNMRFSLSVAAFILFLFIDNSMTGLGGSSLPGLTKQFSAVAPSIPTSQCSSWSCRRRRPSGPDSEPSSDCSSRTADFCDQRRPE